MGRRRPGPGLTPPSGCPHPAVRAHEDRLTELFPDEQRASVDQLVGLLIGPLQAGRASGLAGAGAPRDAEAIYRLVFGILRPT